MQNSKKNAIQFDVYKIAEKIESGFERYGVRIKITDWDERIDRVIYDVKLKGSTREVNFLARVPDVQQRLKFPLFQALIQDFDICLVVSDQEIQYTHLPGILSSKGYAEKMVSMQLPYAIGYDVVGGRVLVDLSDFPHLLMGGASNSGKSVGLQVLLTNIMFHKSPHKVNFILIDVGATNLIPFDGIPHLSYPVVRDRNTACEVLIALKAEMERRIELQISDTGRFDALPRLVLAIDEFPSLFAETEDKQIAKLMIDAVSGMLQRGRHAKIHVVLAAQNPTFQNMKVDLGNITGRIAFKCAKKNFSETIIGEGGAENLLGKGDMLFKCAQFTEVKRIQGIFISPNELQKMIVLIRLLWKTVFYKGNAKFTIRKADLERVRVELADYTISSSLLKKRNSKNNRLFSEVVLWTLSQNEISCNMVMKAFKLGWNRANHFMEMLCEWGIVSDLDAKLPRIVLFQSADDVPKEVMSFLIDNGISEETVVDVISNKN